MKNTDPTIHPLTPSATPSSIQAQREKLFEPRPAPPTSASQELRHALHEPRPSTLTTQTSTVSQSAPKARLKAVPTAQVVSQSEPVIHAVFGECDSLTQARDALLALTPREQHNAVFGALMAYHNTLLRLKDAASTQQR